MRSFRGRRHGKTWAERLADRALPVHTVESVRANWIDASDERLMRAYRQAEEGLGQSETARNVRIALRRLKRERGLR